MSHAQYTLVLQLRNKRYLTEMLISFTSIHTSHTHPTYLHTLTPSQEAFTLVLKGHIALCKAVFPNKTNGEG